MSPVVQLIYLLAIGYKEIKGVQPEIVFNSDYENIDGTKIFTFRYPQERKCHRMSQLEGSDTVVDTKEDIDYSEPNAKCGR